MTVNTSLKLLHIRLGENTAPLQTTFEGEEIVQLEIHFRLEFHIDGVLGVLRGKFELTTHLVVEGQQTFANGPAGIAGSQLFGSNILILSTLCSACLNSRRRLITIMNFLVISVGISQMDHCGVYHVVLVHVLGCICRDI